MAPTKKAPMNHATKHKATSTKPRRSKRLQGKLTSTKAGRRFLMESLHPEPDRNMKRMNWELWDIFEYRWAAQGKVWRVERAALSQSNVDEEEAEAVSSDPSLPQNDPGVNNVKTEGGSHESQSKMGELASSSNTSRNPQNDNVQMARGQNPGPHAKRKRSEEEVKDEFECVCVGFKHDSEADCANERRLKEHVELTSPLSKLEEEKL